MFNLFNLFKKLFLWLKKPEVQPNLLRLINYYIFQLYLLIKNSYKKWIMIIIILLTLLSLITFTPLNFFLVLAEASEETNSITSDEDAYYWYKVAFVGFLFILIIIIITQGPGPINIDDIIINTPVPTNIDNITPIQDSVNTNKHRFFDDDLNYIGDLNYISGTDTVDSTDTEDAYQEIVHLYENDSDFENDSAFENDYQEIDKLFKAANAKKSDI